jgi:centromere protein I
VKNCLKVVEDAARPNGLLPEHILSLSEYIASRNTNSVLLTRAVRCLIPRDSVPCASVLRLLGSLKGHTLSLQLLIIRWIILVYDIIDDRSSLQEIYGVLFYYLQFDDLRPVVCQLLCYMTRRCDVMHYRVQRLTELSKRVDSYRGAEGGLLALLVLYHSLCPHMLTNPQRMRRKVWFRPFEKQLAANIMRLQKARRSDASRPGKTATEEALHKQLTAAPPPLKRPKKQYTAVHVADLSRNATRGERGGGRVTFEAVTTHQQLCNDITDIEFPVQAARVLNSHSLRHMFAVCTEPSAALRFTYWLEHSLGYELDSYSPGSVNPDLKSLLGDLHKLTQFIMEPIPTVESFLHILLEEWNGDDYRNEIMDLLSHLSLQPFDDFEKGFLEPIKKQFVSKDRDFKCQCVHCFSRLLKNMAAFEWPRHQKQQSGPVETDTHRLSLFSPVTDDEVDDFNPLTTINLFIKYVDYLVTIGLEQEKQHVLLYHTAMEFYSVVADLPAVFDVPHLFLPSTSVLITGLLGHSPIFISTACTHLVKVKENLSALSKNQRSLKLTQTFNSVVLDFCNALWRNMIFKKTSKNSEYQTLAFDLPREELQICAITQPHKRLNLVHHPALVGLTIQFLAETQDANKLDQLSPSAIWQETRFKQVYLQFLTQNHQSGISDFIRTFVHTN